MIISIEPKSDPDTITHANHRLGNLSVRIPYPDLFTFVVKIIKTNCCQRKTHLSEVRIKGTKIENVRRDTETNNQINRKKNKHRSTMHKRIQSLTMKQRLESRSEAYQRSYGEAWRRIETRTEEPATKPQKTWTRRNGIRNTPVEVFIYRRMKGPRRGGFSYLPLNNFKFTSIYLFQKHLVREEPEGERWR